MKIIKLIATLCLVLVLSGCLESNSNTYLHAADSQSAHASALVQCIAGGYWNTKIADICDMNTLPFIGQETLSPTIDDVRSRLLVSHNWMADNFLAVLAAMPPVTLNMFRSVTGIVIADDINPSYFWMGNGAIYLNASALSLNIEQTETIDPDATDEREEYAKRLSFLETFRYFDEQGNNIYSAFLKNQRTFDEILLPNATVIFHELSHAIDIYPPAQLDAYNRHLRPYEAQQNYLSDGWMKAHPIADDEEDKTLLEAIARVFNTNASPDPYLDYTGEEIADIFASTHATDIYGFFNPREDFAMNIEEAMMLYYFNVDREYDFLEAPPQGTDFDDWNFPIIWGQQNRILDPLVIDRTAAALELVLADDAQPLIDFMYEQDGPTMVTDGQTYRIKRPTMRWEGRFKGYR